VTKVRVTALYMYLEVKLPFLLFSELEVSSVKGYICNVFVHINVFEIIILY